MGEFVQTLIRHNHNWKDIKEYSLGEIGVFLRESIKEDQKGTNERVLVTWLGFNADKKYIEEHILKSLKSNKVVKKDVEAEQKQAKKEWNRLARDLSKFSMVH